MPWSLNPAHAHLTNAFGDLATVFALEGERLTSAPRSELIRVTLDGVRYYVKRYGRGAGAPRNWRLHWPRYLRHELLNFLPRPRVEAEWRNLERFARWNIPTAEIVAHGLERRLGAFWRGALVTRELEGAEDLHSLYKRDDPRLKDRRWVTLVSARIAAHTRTLHTHRFIHNDLKWRNILVDPEANVYFIDCPLGACWHVPIPRHRIEKDIATLDKVARHCLSATTRLRFYLDYRQQSRLTAADKAAIRRITAFFDP
ncbi:MAG: lipopolysaccharide kinase InaA family protein [Zoogloeaceae bacterium]|jgi:tRNA A-37 threonylcarbamoyl transferase component Bud32|nr:lipopolysaccharide kinase InaA family protein [Zoogloeaceae bacterium]